jgi:hypothetical protein
MQKIARSFHETFFRLTPAGNKQLYPIPCGGCHSSPMSRPVLQACAVRIVAQVLIIACKVWPVFDSFAGDENLPLKNTASRLGRLSSKVRAGRSSERPWHAERKSQPGPPRWSTRHFRPNEPGGEKRRESGKVYATQLSLLFTKTFEYNFIHLVCSQQWIGQVLVPGYGGSVLVSVWRGGGIARKGP